MAMTAGHANSKLTSAPFAIKRQHDIVAEDIALDLHYGCVAYEAYYKAKNMAAKPFHMIDENTQSAWVKAIRAGINQFVRGI
jgi:hypothetical protein